MISEGLRLKINESIKSAYRIGRTYSVPTTDLTYGDWYDPDYGNARGKRSKNGQYKSRTKMGRPLD